MLAAVLLLLLAAVATALPESVIPITAVVLAQELPLGQGDELLVLVLLDPRRGDPQHSGGRLHLHADE